MRGKGGRDEWDNGGRWEGGRRTIKMGDREVEDGGERSRRRIHE